MEIYELLGFSSEASLINVFESWREQYETSIERNKELYEEEFDDKTSPVDQKKAAEKVINGAAEYLRLLEDCPPIVKQTLANIHGPSTMGRLEATLTAVANTQIGLPRLPSPDADAKNGLVIRCRHLYETQTKRKPAIATDWYSGNNYGHFVDLLQRCADYYGLPENSLVELHKHMK